MRAKTIIEALQELDPNTEVMAQWFTKQDVEGNLYVQLTDDHWNVAVELFDKWEAPGSDDFGIRDCIQEAAARLGIDDEDEEDEEDE